MPPSDTSRRRSRLPAIRSRPHEPMTCFVTARSTVRNLPRIWSAFFRNVSWQTRRNTSCATSSASSSFSPWRRANSTTGCRYRRTTKSFTRSGSRWNCRIVVHIVDGMCTVVVLLSGLSLYDCPFYTFVTCAPKERVNPGDERGMKRLLIAMALAVAIPACHGEVQPETVVVVPDPAPVPPSAPFTRAVVQATNYDYFDYAVWIEWEPAAGSWTQTYLFSVYGDPSVGSTINYEIVLADPSVVYYVLLADPWGTLYDTYQLNLPVATSVDVTFNIV